LVIDFPLAVQAIALVFIFGPAQKQLAVSQSKKLFVANSNKITC
jgi:hypothetical protein